MYTFFAEPCIVRVEQYTKPILVRGAVIDPLGEIMEKQKQQWWRGLPPPTSDQEPVLILYLPWNLVHHGDVTPDRRQWLLQNFSDVLGVFEGSGIPVHMSYQKIDVDALALTCDFDPDRLHNLPLLAAPFSHALCGLIGDDYNEHIAWQIESGLSGNVDGPNGEMGYFFPEWDIPANPEQYFGDTPMYCLSVGAFATLYSECAVGDRVDGSVMRYDAIRIGEQTVVPMKGIEGFHRAWFAYQLNDSEDKLADVISAVRAIVAEPKNAGKVVTLFVDGESVLVGGARSFWDDYPLKGYELWARFFTALKDADLARYFHGMEHAYPRWHAAAEPLPTGKAVGRHYGKWCSWKPQERIKQCYKQTLPRKQAGFSAHFLGALDVVSDRLSVTNAMELARKGGLREFIDKDGTKFTMDFDVTIPLVGWRAVETLSGKGAFQTQMRKLRAQAGELLKKEGKVLGPPELFIFSLVEKLYERYEAMDVA